MRTTLQAVDHTAVAIDATDTAGAGGDVMEMATAVMTSTTMTTLVTLQYGYVSKQVLVV